MTPEQATEFWQSLSPERRLALAKAAPKVAGEWSARTGLFPKSGDVNVELDVHSRRSHISGGTVATVWVENGKPRANVNASRSLGLFSSLDEAKSACDAELIRLGYVLEAE